MFDFEKKIILLDTEFTSWEGAMERNWSGENEHRELIQIGAIVVDTNSFEELDSFSVQVKPIKNPILSEYIIELTGITQNEVNETGLTLKSALEKLNTFADGADFYSWGTDGDVILANCKLVGIDCSVAKNRFHDIRPFFAEKGIDVNQYSSSTIPEAFGRKNLNSPHNALDDSRSVLVGLKELALL